MPRASPNGRVNKFTSGANYANARPTLVKNVYKVVVKGSTIGSLVIQATEGSATCFRVVTRGTGDARWLV